MSEQAPSGDRPIASIVVPHYNDPANLDACLDLLNAQSVPRDRYEIIVADNNSPMGIDAVRALVGDRAIVVHAPDPGAGPARNVGVAATSSDILAFTDSDCRPALTWLEEGLAAMKGYDFVGGCMVVSVKDPEHITDEEAFELVFAFHNESQVKKESYSVTANIFMPRRVYDDVGPFRNGAPEDMDWCARAKAKGYRIGYAEKAVVQHPARRTWAETVRKARRLTNEFHHMFLQKRFGALIWVVRTGPLLLSVGPHGLKVLRTSKLPNWRLRLGALKVLVKIRALRFLWAWEVMFHPV